MGGRSSNSKLNTTEKGNTVNNRAEVPAQYRLSGGEDARIYFEYGSYAKRYTVEQFVRDSRTVSLYSGIDFERSGYGYEQQRVEYETALKRWRKQMQYYKENR